MTTYYRYKTLGKLMIALKKAIKAKSRFNNIIVGYSNGYYWYYISY